MSQSVVYPGTFDPITNGHIDIVKRASRMFDRVVVAVAADGPKQAIFTLAERVAFVEQSVTSFDNVGVMSFHGLLAAFAKREGFSIILRSMRAITDFDYECQMAGMNRQLYPDIETLFLTSSEQYCYLSSTMVKEVASFQGDVSAFVPPVVVQALRDLQAS